MKKTILLPALILPCLLLLFSCITDGPNRSGTQFLSDRGFIFERKLDSLTVKGYKVTDFRVETIDSAGVGRNVFAVGEQSGFSASSRFSFLIEKDVLDNTGKGHQLYFGFQPRWGDSDTDSTKLFNLPDSIPVLVKGYILTKPDSMASMQEAIDHFYFAWTDAETLAAHNEWKTNSDSGYIDVNNPYELLLPNISKWVDSIGADTSKADAYLFLEIRSDTSSGSVPLVRFTRPDSPFLIRHTDKNDSTTLKATLNYAILNPGNRNSFYAVAWNLSNPNYAQQEHTSLFSGLRQGVRFRLSRDDLLSAMRKANKSFDINDKSEYNNQYFIPYAAISLPLSDSIYIEDKFSLQPLIQSTLDTLPVVDSDGNEMMVTVELGKTTKSKVLTIVDDDTQEAVDELKFQYFKNENTDSYWLKLIYKNDSNQSDSVRVIPGQLKNYAHAYKVNLKWKPFKFFLSPTASDIKVSTYMESADIRRDAPFESADLGYVTKGDNHLLVKATHSMQRLVNYGTDDLGHTFNFLTLFRNVYAPFKTSSEDEDYTFLTDFGPLADVPLKLNDDKSISIDLTIYFYPL